jgi:hypothetical protein
LPNPGFEFRPEIGGAAERLIDHRAASKIFHAPTSATLVPADSENWKR